MLASQMIYTACGKNKDGAFSVWSKSADVTKAECDEIIKLMSYRKPNNVPYEPTEEELRTLFPKKYCYCNLSSGRKCIALTTYVSKVYSDMDDRNGNFVIHAFIFKDLDGFNPFGLMKLNLFKTSLSYTEWHDNPAPDELPVVEVAANPSIDESSIRNMLTGYKKAHYVSLLQAVIDAANSDSTVTFNDTEENQSRIYSMIGALLPSCLFATTTFSNQYSTQLDFLMASYGLKPIKLRNIFPGMINTAFNYQEQLAAGQAVFYFEKDMYLSIKPKRYLTDVIQSMENGDSLFSVLKKIDKVNSIMKQTTCDIDTAIAVYYLLQKNLAWFNGPDEFTMALNIALQHHLLDEKSVATCLYNDIIATGKWGRDREILSLYKFAYTYGEVQIRKSVIENYFANLQSYGITTQSSPDAVLNQIKDNAPFPWADFVLNVVQNQYWDGYVKSANSLSQRYVVFNGAVAAVNRNFGTNESQNGYYLLAQIMKRAAMSSSSDEMQLYLSCLKDIDENKVNALFEMAFEDYRNKPISDEATLDFVFKTVCALPSEQEKIKLFGELIVRNMHSSQFMACYAKYASLYKNLFDRVESLNRSVNGFADFCAKKEAYIFKYDTKVTLRTLDEYCQKYYRKGADSGVYLEKIKQYILAQENNARINECVRIYEQVRKLDNNFADVLDIIEYLFGSIFALPTEQLLKYAPAHLRVLMEIYDRLVTARRPISDAYYFVRTILLLREKIDSNQIKNAVEGNSVYYRLNSRGLSAFVDEYFSDALSFYVKYMKKKIFPREMLLRAIFERPLTELTEPNGIINALRLLGGSDYYAIMADMMGYGFNFTTKFADVLKSFVKYYVDTMKHGEYKKLFNKVMEYITPMEQKKVKDYTDKYLSDHMSVWEKLFSKRK